MPIIDNNNLILIGLSNGAYAGLKTTENKTNAAAGVDGQPDLVPTKPTTTPTTPPTTTELLYLLKEELKMNPFFTDLHALGLENNSRYQLELSPLILT